MGEKIVEGSDRMNQFTQAILRLPGENFARGLTTSTLGAPVLNRMLEQHAAYAAALRRLGLETHILPPLEEFPDAYFVEDTAVVFPEVAVIAHPGAMERRGEQTSMAGTLAAFRPLVGIEPPGTLDGGDILVAGKDVFIGLSGRTSTAGAAQLTAFLAPLGYNCQTVNVRAGLHLKSGAALIGPGRLLLTREFAADPAFLGYELFILPEDEEYAGNVLLINGSLLMPAGFPQTHALLQTTGLPVIQLDVSEARKMDGGLSCMSLRF